MKLKTIVNPFAFTAAFLALSASAISLDEFTPVHKARVERKGTNDVVLLLNSGEWSAGLVWQSPGADFSQAKYLAVDVENLSKTRQASRCISRPAGRAAIRATMRRRFSGRTGPSTRVSDSIPARRER